MKTDNITQIEQDLISLQNELREIKDYEFMDFGIEEKIFYITKFFGIKNYDDMLEEALNTINMRDNKIDNNIPMWKLDIEELLMLKIGKHEDNIYIIHQHTRMIYDIKTGETICRWGDTGHATEGYIFPHILKPKCCMDCTSTEIIWTNCPFAEDVYGNMVYGWWCNNCIKQRANEI